MASSRALQSSAFGGNPSHAVNVNSPLAKPMTHAEFIAAYAAGKIKVVVDPAAASAYLSARMMLPFVTMAVLGAGVALALIAWIWSGLAVIAIGFIAPRLIKRSAPHFVLTQAVQNAAVYREVTQAGILVITAS
ncbi:MAG: hypothetical protein IH604_09250 [Burkholderiales bacterium]|nr:hypothetical protein [Burkholderiales bacterium]